MNKKIKLIIIEDHALTRIGLKTTLEESQKIEVIAEAEYGEAGVKLAQELEPDIVVMDLGLPNMNGIEATQAIKTHNNNIKVLILTSHDSEDQVMQALKAGADAYCMKDVNPTRLISIIEGIAEGGVWLDPAIAKAVIGKVNISEQICNDESKQEKLTHSPLTDREIEILQLLANGLNNIDIAQELSVSQHTVKAHICNILQKLSVDDRTQAVARAMRQGWIK
ncbi:MAG: Two component transcriptional regulator, LuxR family [uncultured bacterium]|nr:MAG: Two component transcriptional regulator, LuxR family [uncultured bacterium]